MVKHIDIDLIDIIRLPLLIILLIADKIDVWIFILFILSNMQLRIKVK